MPFGKCKIKKKKKEDLPENTIDTEKIGWKDIFAMIIAQILVFGPILLIVMFAFTLVFFLLTKVWLR